MKQKLFIITIILLACLMSGCYHADHLPEENDLNVTIGKDLAIVISENGVVDAEHLQMVLDGKIQKDVPYFDMLPDEELLKLIAYMEDNNYIIVPGRYEINQSWTFYEGKFVLNNGEKRAVLKFKKK